MDGQQYQRYMETLRSLPPCESALEIGFKDLSMTQVLGGSYDLVSIDLPRTVPSEKRRETKSSLVFANICNLPFKDNSFDLVVCCEVLEHLPKAVLESGVAELQRVASKHIFVSVPYRQRVWNELYKCPRCGYAGNTMGHLHYFSKSHIKEMFQGWKASLVTFVGENRGYAPDWLYRLRFQWGGAWLCPDDKRCHACGMADWESAPNALGHILMRVCWRWERLIRPRSSWLFVLFASS